MSAATRLAGTRVTGDARSAILHAAPRADAVALESLVLPLAGGDISITNWRVAAGDKVALIGRNGAGKSSLIETMLGLRSGASVRGSFFGIPLANWQREPALRRRLGAQLQRTGLPMGLTVDEIEAIQRTLFGQASSRALEALDVAALRGKRYDRLSKGERQRIDLFLALGHEPELLFLDEPFAGLDSHFSRSCTQFLSEMPGMTLLMCCHTVDELRLVNQVAWIERGLRAYAPPARLADELLGEFHLHIRCDEPAVAQALVAKLGALGGTRCVYQAGSLEAACYGASELQRAAQELVLRTDVSVEFGKTGLAELLRRCAREA